MGYFRSDPYELESAADRTRNAAGNTYENHSPLAVRADFGRISLSHCRGTSFITRSRSYHLEVKTVRGNRHRLVEGDVYLGA